MHTSNGSGTAGGLVDASDFLAFADHLKDLHRRVASAPVSVQQRRRWQRRLAQISAAGARDLDAAKVDLRRLCKAVDRVGGS